MFLKFYAALVKGLHSLFHKSADGLEAMLKREREFLRAEMQEVHHMFDIALHALYSKFSRLDEAILERMDKLNDMQDDLHGIRKAPPVQVASTEEVALAPAINSLPTSGQTQEEHNETAEQATSSQSSPEPEQGA